MACWRDDDGGERRERFSHSFAAERWRERVECVRGVRGWLRQGGSDPFTELPSSALGSDTM